MIPRGTHYDGTVPTIYAIHRAQTPQIDGCRVIVASRPLGSRHGRSAALLVARRHSKHEEGSAERLRPQVNDLQRALVPHQVWAFFVDAIAWHLAVRLVVRMETFLPTTLHLRQAWRVRM